MLLLHWLFKSSVASYADRNPSAIHNTIRKNLTLSPLAIGTSQSQYVSSIRSWYKKLFIIFNLEQK